MPDRHWWPWAPGPQTIRLAPGAELVPFREFMSSEAEVVIFIGGVWWTLFVHCGPAAPLPLPGWSQQVHARRPLGLPHFYVPTAPYFSLED